MIKEIWVPAITWKKGIKADFTGYYEVSNLGRVKSLGNGKTHKTERILNLGKTRDGYQTIGLCKGGKKKTFRVNRIVWESFNGQIPEGMHVNHINEDKLDNHLDNLNIMSPKENNNWGTRIERLSKSIIQYTLDGVYVHTWLNTAIVEKELGHLGYDSAHIWECCNGKRKTHKGYIWKYKEENSLRDA